MHEFTTSGVCSRKIEFEIDENETITKMKFSGGCEGNLGGISKLVVGMKAREVAEKLAGTKCGAKNTSCPDQLAKALKKAVASKTK